MNINLVDYFMFQNKRIKYCINRHTASLEIVLAVNFHAMLRQRLSD